MTADDAADDKSRRRLSRESRLPVTFALAVLIAAAPVTRSNGAEVIPGGIRLEQEAGLDAVPRDVVDSGVEVTTTGSESVGRTREFVIAPLPSRNPLLGWTLAVPAMFIYKPDIAGESGSPWISGAAAFYAENESAGGGLFHRMSLRDDQWRLTGAAFYADLRYDYFGIGNPGDIAVPLTQDVSLVLAQALYEIVDHLYVGVRGVVTTTEVGLDIPPDRLPPGIEPGDLTQEFQLVSLAPTV
ncbi:MAG TPA: hypothetical protein VLT59_10345, partial [Steroidobacteraceae bacterium]|nr:hypothetical protein [Steroidobacteraceae bacterium]